jgi:hypothetical protein
VPAKRKPADTSLLNNLADAREAAEAFRAYWATLLRCRFYSAHVHVHEPLMQLGEGRNTGDCEMSEKVKSQMISRRAFSFLGLAAALGFALPAEVLTASDAEAQAQTPTPAPAPSGATTGTERRQERRTGRTERRTERRTGRTERRTKRRTGRKERRTKRRGGGEATEKK